MFQSIQSIGYGFLSLAAFMVLVCMVLERHDLSKWLDRVFESLADATPYVGFVGILIIALCHI